MRPPRESDWSGILALTLGTLAIVMAVLIGAGWWG